MENPSNAIGWNIHPKMKVWSSDGYPSWTRLTTTTFKQSRTHKIHTCNIFLSFCLSDPVPLHHPFCSPSVCRYKSELHIHSHFAQWHLLTRNFQSFIGNTHERKSALKSRLAFMSISRKLTTPQYENDLGNCIK